MKPRPALLRPIGVLRVERLAVHILRTAGKRKEGSQRLGSLLFSGS